jgi:uncharacterized membrane protein AbrB (regulator of aidB expression)
VSAILKLALTIFAALAGARLFERIHAPAPMVSGSIIGVTACTLLFPGWTFFPAELKTFVQICSGATIGSRVSRRNIREMRYLLISAVALIASLLAFNIVCAIGLFHTGIRSIPTAMFSSAPGGISIWPLWRRTLAQIRSMWRSSSSAGFYLSTRCFPF